MKKKSNASLLFVFVVLAAFLVLVKSAVKDPKSHEQIEKEEAEQAQEQQKAAKPAETVAAATPPAAAATAGQATPEMQAKEAALKKEVEMTSQYRGRQMPKNRKPTPNPEAIDPDSIYFTKVPDGQSGMSEVDKQVAAAKAELKKQTGKDPVVTPRPAPTMAPAATTKN